MVGKLRYIMAAVLLLAFVAVLSLLVRGYRLREVCFMRLYGDNYVRVSSQSGRLGISTRRFPKDSDLSWMLLQSRAGLVDRDDYGKTSDSIWFQVLRWKSGLAEYRIPLWPLVIAFPLVALAVSPKRQFSLKFLLIGFIIITTSVAIAVNWHSVPPEDELGTEILPNSICLNQISWSHMAKLSEIR